MIEMTGQLRALLEHRNENEKIAVARHQELCPYTDLPLISLMVREGVIVFLEETVLPMAAVSQATGRILPGPLSFDIYQLTDAGIALCEEHGIKQR